MELFAKKAEMINSVNCVWEARRDLHGNDLEAYQFEWCSRKRKRKKKKKMMMSRVNIAQSGGWGRHLIK